jgi:hypothetical protein
MGMSTATMGEIKLAAEKLDEASVLLEKVDYCILIRY